MHGRNWLVSWPPWPAKWWTNSTIWTCCPSGRTRCCQMSSSWRASAAAAASLLPIAGGSCSARPSWRGGSAAAASCSRQPRRPWCREDKRRCWRPTVRRGQRLRLLRRSLEKEAAHGEGPARRRVGPLCPSPPTRRWRWGQGDPRRMAAAGGGGLRERCAAEKSRGWGLK